MRSNELVVRELIREWMLLEAEGEAGGDVLVSTLGGIESLGTDIDAALDKVDDKLDSLSEDAVMLALGTILSIPTLIKWTTKAVSMIIKGYVALAKKVGASDIRGKEAMADFIESAGIAAYEKGHHMVEGFFVKVVKALMIMSVAASGGDAAKTMSDWVEGPGSGKVKLIAKTLDLAVTTILAVFSVKGAIHAIGEAHAALAATEGVLTAVKGAHIAEAIGIAISRAGKAIASAFAEAGIASAVTDAAIKKVGEFLISIRGIIVSGMNATLTAAVAAGIAVSVATGNLQSDNGKGGEEVSIQDS